MIDLNKAGAWDAKEQLEIAELLRKLFDGQMAEELVDAFFALGAEPGDPTQRIAFKGGTWPDKETDQGGMNKVAMTRWLQKAMIDAATGGEG